MPVHWGELMNEELITDVFLAHRPGFLKMDLC